MKRLLTSAAAIAAFASPAIAGDWTAKVEYTAPLNNYVVVGGNIIDSYEVNGFTLDCNIYGNCMVLPSITLTSSIRYDYWCPASQPFIYYDVTGMTCWFE